MLTFLNVRLNRSSVFCGERGGFYAYEMHMGCNRYIGFFVASDRSPRNGEVDVRYTFRNNPIFLETLICQVAI